MKRSTNPCNKVFLRPQYALHYRRAQRPRWSSEARSDYVALILLQGKLSASVDDAAMELDENGALLIEPGAMAQARGRAAEFLSLTLASSYLLDCATRTHLAGSGSHISFPSAAVERDERLAHLARELVEELLKEEAGHETVIAALIEQLTVHLLRRHSNARRSEELELSRVGLVDRRIRRAVELMHAHLDRDLPLEEIAAAAHLSSFHFARLFKKLTGASPHAYLATLRIARAQSLLAETDLNITEISARVGYSSPSHFTKAFRQSTGLAPRAFRAALVK